MRAATSNIRRRPQSQWWIAFYDVVNLRDLAVYQACDGVSGGHLRPMNDSNADVVLAADGLLQGRLNVRVGYIGSRERAVLSADLGCHRQRERESDPRYLLHWSSLGLRLPASLARLDYRNQIRQSGKAQSTTRYCTDPFLNL